MEVQEPPPSLSFGEQLMAFFEKGDVDEAIDFAETVIDGIRMRLGSDDDLEAELALALESQSDFFRAIGENQKAEMGYLEGLHFLERNEGFEEDRARINASLAVLHDFNDNPGKAKEHYLQAIQHFENLEPPALLDVADFCNNLAFIYESEGNFDQAEASFKKALTLTQSEVGMENEMTALRYNNLGTFYFKRDQQDRARELHLTALQVRQRILGEDHLDTSESYHNLALVNIREGKVNEGLENFERALSGFESNLEAGSEDYETVAANYRDVLESLGEMGALNDLENRVKEALDSVTV